MTIAENAVRATDLDMQPAQGIPGDRGYVGYYLYFVAFICISAFVFVKMFVGVVYSEFHKARMEHDGSAFLTDSQAGWVHTQRKLLTVTATLYYPPPEGNGWRKKVYKLVMAHRFERFILGALVLNVVFMAITWWQQPNVGLIIVLHLFINLTCRDK